MTQRNLNSTAVWNQIVGCIKLAAKEAPRESRRTRSYTHKRTWWLNIEVQKDIDGKIPLLKEWKKTVL